MSFLDVEFSIGKARKPVEGVLPGISALSSLCTEICGNDVWGLLGDGLLLNIK